MRLVIAAALLLLAALVQSLVGPSLPLVGSRPDFVFVIVLAWAMLRGSYEGAAVGFLGGFLLDAVSATPYGLNAALYGIAGYATGLGETNLYRGNLPFFLGTGAAATLLYHTTVYFALQAFGQVLPPLAVAYGVALPAAAMNAALLAPAFLVCRRLLRALGGWRQMRV